MPLSQIVTRTPNVHCDFPHIYRNADRRSLGGVAVRVAYRFVPPTVVLYAREFGPYKVSAQRAWTVIGSWLERHQLRAHVRRGYGVLRDNPNLTAPDLLRYDACIPVPPGLDIDEDGKVRCQVLPGGAYAVHAHSGSYMAEGGLFSTLYRDIVPKRTLSVDVGRPFMAVYLNDPLVTPAVHRRTELCVPVVPIAGTAAPSNDMGGTEMVDARARPVRA